MMSFKQNPTLLNSLQPHPVRLLDLSRAHHVHPKIILYRLFLVNDRNVTKKNTSRGLYTALDLLGDLFWQLSIPKALSGVNGPGLTSKRNCKRGSLYLFHFLWQCEVYSTMAVQKEHEIFKRCRFPARDCSYWSKIDLLFHDFHVTDAAGDLSQKAKCLFLLHLTLLDNGCLETLNWPGSKRCSQVLGCAWLLWGNLSNGQTTDLIIRNPLTGEERVL